MRLFLSAAAIISLLLTLPVFAQEQVMLSGEGVKPGQRTYEYIRETDTSSVVFASLKELIEKKDGFLKIRYQQSLPRFVMTDSLILNPETFIPIRYGSFIKGHQSNYVDYSDPNNLKIGVNVSLPQFTKDSTYTDTLEEVRYDGHWHTLLLYGLDLKNGLNIELPIYTYNRGKENYGVEVTGEENITLYGNTYEAWKVKLTRFGMPNSEVWIDKKTGLLLKDKTPGYDGTIYLIQYKESM